MNERSKRFADFVRDLQTTPEYKQEELATEIAITIHKRLEGLGKRQSELADELGVSRAYISQVLSGKPNMTLSTLVRLADALGLEADVRLVENRRPTVISTNVQFESAADELAGEPWLSAGTVLTELFLTMNQPQETGRNMEVMEA